MIENPSRRRFVVTLRATEDDFREDLADIEVHELDHAIEAFVAENVGADELVDMPIEVSTEEANA